MSFSGESKLGTLSTLSIGIGGMVGGGIFAVTGLTVEITKGSAPIAFLLAGLVALLTSYSYLKLTLRYPGEGGTVAFLVIVLYVLIAIVVVGHLGFAEVAKASDTALSVAALDMMGRTGYIAIAVAALMATSSAINATFFGTGRLAYVIAKVAF